VKGRIIHGEWWPSLPTRVIIAYGLTQTAEVTRWLACDGDMHSTPTPVDLVGHCSLPCLSDPLFACPVHPR